VHAEARGQALDGGAQRYRVAGTEYDGVETPPTAIQNAGDEVGKLVDVHRIVVGAVEMECAYGSPGLQRRRRP